MGNALHTPGAPGVGAVSPAEARLDDAGLVAVHGPGLLDARTGVMHGPGSTALVTGTADTAPMAYLVAPHHWVTGRGVASDGVYRGALEAARRVTTGAAPASGSRVDVLWVKQSDAYSTISPDATTDDVYGCTQGDPGAGKPPIPVGAEELATATVSAGATATNGSGVAITNTARLTAARGAPVPVRSQAERDALTTHPGLHVTRLDLGGVIQRWVTSATWASYAEDVGSTTWTNVMRSTSYSISVPGTSFSTIPSGGPYSVTVPGGRVLEVEFSAPLVDVPAGTGLQLRIVMGGTVEDGGYWSNSNAAAMAMPARLRATKTGSGASMAFQVEALKVGGGTPSLRGEATAPVILRHRIV